MGKENYLARRFEPALEVVPEEDREMVNALIRILEPATAFFRAQRAEGFYGNLTAGARLPAGGDSPYTIIRSEDGDRVYGYGEVDPYKGYLRDIAKRINDAVDTAFATKDPERNLFEATLRPRAIMLKEGKFAEAMTIEMNTRLTPRYHLFVGLLDRYLDPRGFKFAMQGWLQRIDKEEDAYFNEIARQLPKNPLSRFRVIYGDMLAAGGLTAERPWSGNTVPSEDDIRSKLGADSYVFSNNMDDSTREVDIPAVKRYVPQITQSSNWEEMMYKAKKIAITAHETGHAAIPFDAETINLLDGRYMAIKELLAELFAVKRIGKLPKTSSYMKQLIYSRSLASWRNYIDQYHQESDPDKKAILSHYAWAGAWRTNYQEREGGIVMNQDGTMEIPDCDKFVSLDNNLYHEFINAIKNEKYDTGFVEGVIQLNSQNPRIYMRNGGDHDSFPPQAVAA